MSQNVLNMSLSYHNYNWQPFFPSPGLEQWRLRLHSTFMLDQHVHPQGHIPLSSLHVHWCATLQLVPCSLQWKLFVCVSQYNTRLCLCLSCPPGAPTACECVWVRVPHACLRVCVDRAKVLPHCLFSVSIAFLCISVFFTASLAFNSMPKAHHRGSETPSTAVVIIFVCEVQKCLVWERRHALVCVLSGSMCVRDLSPLVFSCCCCCFLLCVCVCLPERRIIH